MEELDDEELELLYERTCDVVSAIDEDGDVVDRFKRPARRIDASRAGVTDAPEAGAGFTNLATPPVQ